MPDQELPRDRAIAAEALADEQLRNAMRLRPPVRHEDATALTPEQLLRESRSELVERLRGEIESAGPITFARFMEIALYDPVDGYYARRDDRPTRSGDFLTAPETHPLFAATFALQLEEMWERLDRPHGFVLREHGAGRGTFGLGVAVALRHRGSPLLEALRYSPVERGPAPAAAIVERFAAEGLADVIDEPTGAFVGCGFANEVLDALPVHRLEVGADGSIEELYVTWRDGWFADEPGPPSDAALIEPLQVPGVALEPGQRVEVRPAATEWIEGAADELERGWLVLIDYGYDAPELYGPRRRGGTLRSFREHRAGSDPYRAAGEQDLTAHVDWTHVEAVAKGAGLSLVGAATQAEFLIGAGLEGLMRALQDDPATEPGDYLLARASVLRFLDPAQLGRFRVLVLGRGVADESPLSGLSFSVRRPARTSPTP